MLITACDLPIRVSSPAAPTADTVLLETIVAETFAAAVQGASATPTVTPTPPVLNADTATPVPPTAGSMLIRQDDNSTLFVDNSTGLEVAVPSGWLALRPNEPEFLEAWNLAEAADPAIQGLLAEIAEQDPEQSRLFAIDTQAAHVQRGFVTQMKFVWDRRLRIQFADTTDLDATAASLRNAIPGLEVISVETSTNANGVSFGSITWRQPGETGHDPDVEVFHKQVYLHAKTGALVITLSTTAGLGEAILPGFDAMIESIKAGI